MVDSTYKKLEFTIDGVAYRLIGTLSEPHTHSIKNLETGEYKNITHENLKKYLKIFAS